jgi:hypothetical protein
VYLIMGWLIVIAIRPLALAMPGILWLVAGRRRERARLRPSGESPRPGVRRREFGG